MILKNLFMKNVNTFSKYGEKYKIICEGCENCREDLCLHCLASTHEHGKLFCRVCRENKCILTATESFIEENCLYFKK